MSDMEKYFQRSIPEEQGVDSMNIKLFLQELDNRGYQMNAFLMLRHGKIVAEVAKYPVLLEDKRLVYSSSKSFTGTAIGIAVKEGLLDIEDKVLSFFQEYEDMELDDRVRRLTVKNLLTMSTGHGFDSIGAMCNGDSDWVKTFLTREMTYEPGEKFVYDSGGTYMLSEIISRVTGMPMVEYLKEKLFKPLHIMDVMWDFHGNVNTGGWGVLIAPEDLAKLGMLYLQKGIFEETQILTKEWVDEATRGQIPTEAVNSGGWSKAYGYQIWKNNENSFRTDGAFGQLCMVFPEEDMVVVTTAEEVNPARMYALIEKYLLSDLSDIPYGKNTIVYGELKKYLMSWEVPEIFAPSESYMEQILPDNEYVVRDAENKEHHILFDLTNSRMEMRIDDIQIIKSSKVTYADGKTRYVIMPPSVSPIIGEEQRTREWYYSARHEWVNDGTLQITIYYRETGHKQRWLLIFSEDQVEIVISNSCKRIFGLIPIKSDKNVDFGDMILKGVRVKK